MKSFNILLVVLIIIYGCKDTKGDVNTPASNSKSMDYVSYGAKITSDEALNTVEILEKCRQLNSTDTLEIKLKGKVKSVCKAKGCWMEVELAEGENLMVRFKDYGFFVPTSIENQIVIVEGFVYSTEMSVKDQEHYALDAKDHDTKNKINGPKMRYELIADGLLLQE